MRNNTSSERLLNALNHGKIYRRQELTTLSTSVDRDLKKLTTSGHLQKVGNGLYLYPKKSRWGNLPADTEELAKSFLKTSDLLLVSNNDYNSLGLGLTQLWNEIRVYNKRRHGKFKLGNTDFDFQVPFNGYPKKLSPEFLLVDLINNLDTCGETPSSIKEKVKKQISMFDIAKLSKLNDKHGKLATKRFFRQLLENI